MNIFYVYRTARRKMLESVINKEVPDHFLYGFNHLSKLGYDVNFSDIAYQKLNILFWLFYPLQLLIIKLTFVGFKIDQAILLYPNLIKSDLIITTTDSAGLPILFLKKIKLLKNPIIFTSIGLINELEKRKKNWIRWFYLSLFHEADVIIVYSLIEKRLYSKLDQNLKKKVRYITFGIDSNFFKNNKIKKKQILSVGRDKSRDFLKLSRVARLMPDQEFIVITSPSNIKKIKFPENVTVHFDLPYIKVKAMYEEAKIVFLPMREIYRASGQTTFLEGLAAGCLVVVDDIKGLKETYPKNMLSKNVIIIKDHSTKQAIIALTQALNKTAKVSLNDIPTSKLMFKQLEKIINELKYQVWKK